MVYDALTDVKIHNNHREHSFLTFGNPVGRYFDQCVRTIRLSSENTEQTIDSGGNKSLGLFSSQQFAQLCSERYEWDRSVQGRDILMWTLCCACLKRSEMVERERGLKKDN